MFQQIIKSKTKQKTWKKLGISSISFSYMGFILKCLLSQNNISKAPGVPVKLSWAVTGLKASTQFFPPSRELTYPTQKALLKVIFPFPKVGYGSSWRVTWQWKNKHSTMHLLLVIFQCIIQSCNLCPQDKHMLDINFTDIDWTPTVETLKMHNFERDENLCRDD